MYVYVYCIYIYIYIYISHILHMLHILRCMLHTLLLKYVDVVGGVMKWKGTEGSSWEAYWLIVSELTLPNNDETLEQNEVRCWNLSENFCWKAAWFFYPSLPLRVKECFIEFASRWMSAGGPLVARKQRSWLRQRLHQNDSMHWASEKEETCAHCSARKLLGSK